MDSFSHNHIHMNYESEFDPDEDTVHFRISIAFPVIVRFGHMPNKTNSHFVDELLKKHDNISDKVLTLGSFLKAIEYSYGHLGGGENESGEQVSTE